jgi:hypothetical protein
MKKGNAHSGIPLYECLANAQNDEAMDISKNVPSRELPLPET